MSRLLLLFILIFILDHPAQAGISPLSCAKGFRDLILGKEGIYVDVVTTPEQRQAIAEFASQQGSTPEVMKAVWQKYVEIRVAALPESTRRYFTRDLNEFYDEVEFADRRFIANNERIRVPQELQDSAGLLALLAHEGEHRIQFALISDKGTTDLKSALYAVEAVMNPVKLWRVESGAMRAEWEMINALPPEVLKRANADLDKIKMSGSVRRLLRSMIAGKGLSSEEYLKMQYRRGRYSFGQVAVEITGRRLFLTYVLGSMLYGAAAETGESAVTSFCENLSSENPVRINLCAPAKK